MGIKKRGVSPKVATVLLIALVLVMLLIIFFWFMGTSEPAIQKFGEDIKLSCEKLSFTADYSDGKLELKNNGNVPISDAKISVSRGGSDAVEDINNIVTNWNGLSGGRTFSSEVNINMNDVSEILVIPVLRGNGEGGEQDYVCDDEFGELAYNN